MTRPRPPRTTPYWFSPTAVQELREFLKSSRFDKPELSGIRTEIAVSKHRADTTTIDLTQLSKALGYTNELPIYLYKEERDYLLSQADLPETVKKAICA